MSDFNGSNMAVMINNLPKDEQVPAALVEVMALLNEISEELKALNRTINYFDRHGLGTYTRSD